MMKKFFCMLLALTLALSMLPAAMAEDTTANDGMLTWEELESLAASFMSRALETQPMNDPTEAAAYSEDGYCFIYDFGYLYCDRPEMTEDTQLNAIVLYSPDEYGPRGTHVDMAVSAVLDAFYTENEDLDGSYTSALIYYSELMPQEAGYGVAQRDGQRVQVVQYTIHDQYASGGDGYTDAGVVYTIEEDEVSVIRLYGLSSRVDEAAVRADQASAAEMGAERGYRRVPTSTDGTTLSVFELEDLSFEDFDFQTVTPDEALAIMGDMGDDTWEQQADGTWLRAMEFPFCVMTFAYNADKEAPVLQKLLIDVDGMEGPRGCRVGDSVTMVLSRFRNENTVWDDGEYTMLYGQKQTAPYGTVAYGDDASAEVTYVQSVDGRNVVLAMHFELLYLQTITLYWE